MQMLPEGQKGDIELSWEDQSKINQFSKLNSRLDKYEAELKKLQTDKEYIDDVTMELELVDEDEQVQYKVGETFVFLPHPEVMERLEKDQGRVNQQVEQTEQQLSSINEQMSVLRKELYAKLGDSINLEV